MSPLAGSFLLAGLLLAASAVPAQQAVYESEPNNTPAEANRIAGEVTVFGTMVEGDQDGFMWTVSDDDARRRWTFELEGIPGRLTIAEIVRVEFADNGVDVVGYDKLMKMGTRDGLTPSVAADLLFDPGEYLIGIAYAGGGAADRGGGMFRPPTASVSFGDDGRPALAPDGSVQASAEPGAYRFLIREGARLATSDNPGVRETRETARAMRLGREFATFETRETTWYKFAFDAAAAQQRWDIRAQVPVGRRLSARLVGADGEALATAAADDRGLVTFPDLAPPPETWFVELRAADPGLVHAVSSEIVGQRVTGEEAEPNGEWRLANRVDLSQPLRGRISTTNEWDYFLFSLDEAAADQVLKLRIETTPPQALEFCLLAEDKTRVQCRRATAPIELPDLVLAPGVWGLSVTRAGEGMEYEISLSGQGAIQAGMEAEPNDAIEFASSVPANNVIKGRLSGNEADFFRFNVGDKPQLWRFQVIGDGITEVAYYDGSGSQAARVRPKAGQTRSRLENLFLMPGQHFLRVSGRDGGSYTVLARALGPPDPNGELEPNDDVSRMQRLAMGQTRNGLLADTQDSDYYRFFLANWDHIRLTVQPAADGVVHPYLYWYGQPLADGKPSGPGKPIVMSGLFPPGDYHLALTARQVSDAEYHLSLERLERFSCPVDCEPNGVRSLYLAAPLPQTLVVEGNAGQWNDTDVYQLPALDEPSELIVSPALPLKSVWAADHRGDGKLLAWDAGAGVYRGTIPSGEPYYLHVRSDGEDYRLALEFVNGPEALPASEPLAARLELVLDAEQVSAYRQHGQKVTGRIKLLNTGSSPLRAELDAVTSDYRWQVSLQGDSVELAANSETSVPLEVLVPPDAWADRPVRLSIRARDAAGAQQEAWREIAVDRDSAPVNPYRGWQVPEALLGGLNAAWAAHGGRLEGEYPNAVGLQFGELIDGKTVMGNGMALRGWDGVEPRTVTVELAGGKPLPVAGVALNHFGSTSIFADIRKATLLLSEDGSEFLEALRIETQPVKTEQFFALEKPVMARFARLRLDASFDLKFGQGGARLGEWKVITRPGHDFSGGRGFNLADPVLGGHIVWADPTVSVHWDNTILTEKQEKASTRLRPGQDLEWVVGFHHNRAAQISRLEWVQPRPVPGESLFDRVTVSASLDSPVGPWQPLAVWEFNGAETAVLDIEQPAWARFLKFTAPGPESLQHRYAPETLRVWERPTSDTYRSVLGEWGHARRESFYEHDARLAPEPPQVQAGNDSRTTAAQLAPDGAVAGEVSLGRHGHWYRLRVPEGQNTLSVTLTGDPTVRTVLALEDGEGSPVPLTRKVNRSIASRHDFEAVVEPGASYFLRVTEPPRNVIFSWDTSPSVNAYLSSIYNALLAFSSQVVPGREAVNLAPFGRGPLLRDWHGEPHVLQTILNAHPRGESSSAAEQTLKKSAQALGPLAGSKAIVLITDAATTRDPTMWPEMETVRPRIFSVGIAGTRAADEEQDRFQDWSSVNGGYYTHLVYDGEMEVAFDRAATMLRRPAGYTLTVETGFREAPGPGSLTVKRGDGVAGGGGSAAVELILDASGSMLQRMDGKRRIAIAKEVLKETVQKHIPAGMPVALRVFGHKEPNACRSDLEMPLAPLDPAAAMKAIDGIQAMNLARTPIADSLASVQGDLKGASGRVAIVLVTDGEETCEGDPGKVIEALQEKDFEISLNIVGFAINDAELAAQFESWAQLGGGRYFAANDQGGLSAALQEALRLPFTVYDQGGNEVATGQVGGAPVELEQGFYRVVANTAPPQTFEKVEVQGEDQVVLVLD